MIAISPPFSLFSGEVGCLMEVLFLFDLLRQVSRWKKVIFYECHLKHRHLTHTSKRLKTPLTSKALRLLWRLEEVSTLRRALPELCTSLSEPLCERCCQAQAHINTLSTKVKHCQKHILQQPQTNPAGAQPLTWSTGSVTSLEDRITFESKQRTAQYEHMRRKVIVGVHILSRWKISPTSLS